jgi:hypothetical protein
MVGAGISIISLLAATTIGVIQINAAQRPKRDIQCVTISAAPLVKISKGFKEDLQVSYRGRIIEDANSIILKIKNSGKSAITPSDFVRPIAFMFSSNTEIISAEVLATEPKNLGAEISITKNNIELQPLLMNSGDSILISTIVALFDGNIAVDGRVVDIKLIKMSKYESSEDKLEKLSSSFQFITFLLYVTISILSYLFLGKDFYTLSGQFLNTILNSFGLGLGE